MPNRNILTYKEKLYRNKNAFCEDLCSCLEHFYKLNTSK